MNDQIPLSHAPWHGDLTQRFFGIDQAQSSNLEEWISNAEETAQYPEVQPYNTPNFMSTSSVILNNVEVHRGSHTNVDHDPCQVIDAPKSRKRKAPTLKDNVWDPYKSMILELHIKQGLPLPEVKKRIEKKTGFVAELRQYRSRITKWGKDKNIKTREMKSIVKKRQYRRLKEGHKAELAFTVRENPVLVEKIERWMKRYNVDENELYLPSSAASTPSAISCRTLSVIGTPIHTPAPPSPACSITSLIRPRSRLFTGQSPTPAPRFLTMDKAAEFTTLIPGNMDTGVGSMDNLSKPRYKEAYEFHLRRQLGQSRNVFELCNAEVLETLYKLSVVLLAQGRYKSAEDMACRAADGYRKLNGETHITTVNALSVVASLFNSQGLYSKGRALEERVIGLKESLLGREHSSTLDSMCSLAFAIKQLGDIEDAETMLKAILKMVDDPPTQYQRVLVGCMRYLAQIFHQQGRMKEAEEMVVHSMKLAEVYGKQDLLNLQLMTVLTILYIDTGRLQEAQKITFELLDIVRTMLGEEHPLTLSTMGNLATIFQLQGLYDDALELGETVLDLQKKVLGQEHPSTLISMEQLANVYYLQGRLDDSERLNRTVLELIKKSLGEEHPNVLAIMYNMALVWKDQGRCREARDLMTKCIEIRKRIIGPQHPFTLEPIQVLNRWQMEYEWNMRQMDLGVDMLGHRIYEME